MELVGRVENQLLIGQLNDLCILKTGGDNGGSQVLFQVVDDLGPGVGSSRHKKLLSVEIQPVFYGKTGKVFNIIST
jgi:hypothetical protein